VETHELLDFARKVCESLDLVYFVTGSTATISYGEPRFTNDIDIVVDLPREKIPAFLSEFPTDQFYLSRQAIEEAVLHGTQFNVIHPSSGLKIDFIILTTSDFDKSRSARRRQLAVLPKHSLWFAAPEDVIIKKMMYYQDGRSDKHLRDIAGVLRIQEDAIDRTYIQSWADKLGLREIWIEIVAREANQS
jgi:hypothetical protein